MEIQISPLVLILSCCRVGSRSIAERSLAVARLRIRRRDIMLLGASASTPTSRNGGKLRAAALGRRAFCSPLPFGSLQGKLRRLQALPCAR